MSLASTARRAIEAHARLEKVTVAGSNSGTPAASARLRTFTENVMTCPIEAT